MFKLESQFSSSSISREDPFDTLVVLGGGTTEGPDGRAQLSHYGDRLGLAMQFYHRGLVKKFVVTGDSPKGLEQPSGSDPSVQSRQILMGIGVPDAAVEELPGSNTSQEMRALKARPNLWQGKRCGLITSAFHMPRAIRLAKKNGVDVLPIPADFRARREGFVFRDLVPSAHGAVQFDLALREYLGMLVGR
jgi:uncharacterized SAM-binding protein YcdF (DUF218 family)